MCLSFSLNSNKSFIKLRFKGTIMHIFHLPVSSSSYANTFNFLRYAHVRYVKRLFTIIQKQQNMLKISLLLKRFKTLRSHNLRILRITNAKFSEHCFYINTNIYGDFQICISVHLNCSRFCKSPHKRLLTQSLQ